MKYIASFVVSIIFFMYAMGVIINEKINLKKPRTYICYFFILFLYLINCEYNSPLFRIAFNIIIFIIMGLILFKKDIKEAIVLGMLVFLYGMGAEFIYAILARSVINELMFFYDNNVIVFINNFCIGVILLLISYALKNKDIYHNVLSSLYKINEKKITIFSLYIIVIFNLFCLISYSISKGQLNFFYLPYLSAFLSILIAPIIFIYLRTNSKYLNIYEKYNISLDSIREFEIMIENYRINTHENKNQFRTIRNMSKNKKVVSYIDALLDENISDDEKLLSASQRIPTGGLRGIIYSKLLLMQSRNIPFELVVDKNVTMSKIDKIDEHTLTDICRILGVLLDNAIDEVQQLNDQCVMVELYEEDKDIVVAITNNYEGFVDIDTINNPGISTKGKNHGYGLSLVKSLVSKNKKIQHTSEFFEDNFMQKIKIKV